MSFRNANKTNVNDAFYKLLRDIGRGTFRRGLDNEIKIRKRVNYPVYSLIKRGQDILMRYTRVKVSGFYKHFNINKTNRVVGYTPDFVGASRSNVVKARNFVSEFISDNFDTILNSVSSSCARQLVQSINQPRVVYSAGYDTSGAHLKEYFKDNTTEEYISREDIINILSYSNFKWFRSPVCSFTHGSEIFDYVRANLDSYPGHYSQKIFGNMKLFGDELSRNVAYKLWSKMKDKPIKNLYLWKILGREKDIKIGDYSAVDKEVGTRVVITCESPITYFLMWIAQKFNYILGYADWDRTFNLCGEFNADKAFKLTKRAQEYDYILEADWSYYDSNIDTNFLEVGAALLCNGVPDSKLENNIVTTFIMSVVTKYVIIPPGIVVELNRSQPSGHPAGSLINCFVNLIYWCIIGYKIYGENYADYMHVEVYGDDTRAFFKHSDKLQNIDQYIKEVGLKSEPVLQNLRSTKFECDLDKDIDFLKRRFNTVDFVWNHKKMFDKWLYPSRNRKLNDQIQMVNSYLSSVPTDRDVSLIVKLFNKWATEKFGDEIDRNTSKVIKSIDRLIGDDNARINSFRFELSGQNAFKHYNEQIELHKFSVSRFRSFWVNEKFSINYSVAKHLILYYLSLDDQQLATANLKDFTGMNHPPPLFIDDPDYILRRTERLHKREVYRTLNKFTNNL
jgi:hypothetical protein